MTEEFLTVYNEGYFAFFFGIDQESNPYEGILSEYWNDGWNDAEEECPTC